jgi:predicted nucleic acid-binding protein
LKAYGDTSFLFSLYAPDANSEAAAAESRRPAVDLLITALCELELINALQLRVFRKELTSGQVDAAYGAFQADLVLGVYSVFPFSTKVFETARRLSLRHTAGIGSRSLDVFHVAAALTVGADVLFSFDETQKKLAKAAGLRTAPAPQPAGKGS